MSAPEFARPSAGDELIVVEYRTRYRPRSETPVRVKAVARFRVTVEGMDGEKLPWCLDEWDLRTQHAWQPRASDRAVSSHARSPRLHTAETLAYEVRLDAAEAYLSGNRLHLWDLSGSLRKAVDADKIGFVNALRRFEGLDEI